MASLGERRRIRVSEFSMARFSAEEDEGEEEEEVARGTKRKIAYQEPSTAEKQKKNAVSKNGNFKEGEESSGAEKELIGGGISASIDPDVLDCPICFEPLRPPLFQCQNGHVACSSCCNKLQNKCPSCQLSIDYSRCLALEKVIEAIKIPCSYTNSGCKEKISYAERTNHEDTCAYVPCFCPMLSCTFSGSTRMLSSHFDDCHKGSFNRLMYGVQVLVFLESKEPFRVFQGDEGELFLLLNRNGGANAGNALSMTCICPQTLDDRFTYELKVTRKKNALRLNASMTNVKKWTGSYPTDVFLLVPQDFWLCEQIFVTVRIQKCLP